MTFDDVLVQVVALLQRQGRVSYGALKRRFALDDAYLDDLKTELIDAQRLAVDEEGRILVWSGAADTPLALSPAPPAEGPPQEHTSPVVPQAAEAERRHLTVLFCDLVDSTTLAGRLDPEEWRDVVLAYQAACAKVIQRFAGHIAQYLGDGMLVYFGYPQAHEDDAHRAVHTGLGILQAMATLYARLAQERGIRLAVRLGIHTGVVVVGTVGGGTRQEHLALGDTPNIAARLQGLAAPDTIVISAATFQLVEGYFTCHALGAQTLKGVATPLQVYQVVRENSTQSRFDVATTRGLTPMVGREQEVGVLLARWAQARDGMGQVVVISGEAGIGKSRLVQMLKEHVVPEPHARVEWRGSPYEQYSALHPVVAHLHRFLQWHPDAAPEDKLRTLEEALAAYGLALPDVVPLFATLLSLPLPARYPPLTLTPERQKQKTLAAVLTWLLAEATRQPVLFIVEDLHWIDPSTLELLTLLIDQGPTARMLTLLTCRPEFCPPWGFRAHLTPLTLSRLSAPQAEQMIARVAGGKELPPEVVQQIVAKTDGVPLFVEELSKMVLESGLLREQAERYELTGPLPPFAIPATLHDSLMARLDRLNMVKTVMQLGATIGRTFSYALLQAVTVLDEATLQHGLEQLVQAELLFQRGVGAQATYMFKHALIQDAAYQSLLKSTRQQYHQRIAQRLEAQWPETVATEPELVAHHYTAAGLLALAVTYWQRAGQRALQRSACVEAINHLTRALELLATLPDTPEHRHQELEVQTTLGPALSATKGYAAPDVERTYTRARELCQQVGETPQLFPVLWGLWGFYFVRGEFRTGRELGEQCLALAQRTQDTALLLEAHLALGAIVLRLGEVASARTHLEQGIALYDPQQHCSHAFRYGQDPGVACLSDATYALWLLGYPDQAVQRSHEALILAQDLSHPASMAFALCFAAWLHQHRREVQATQKWAEVAMTLATEQGFALFLAQATVLRGWALTEQGQEAEGIAQMRQGLGACQATGAELFQPYYLALLAEAEGKVGKTEGGLGLLAEALTAAAKTGERVYEAELYRVKGELLLGQAADRSAALVGTAQPAMFVGVEPSVVTEIEACFRRALAIARSQQARSLELRAAMSLSRLWQRQGKRGEAQQLLEELYGWFTEGFTTADLQEARALLEAWA